MPYKIVVCGIYKIVNKNTNKCYVGQSTHIYKRIAEHFRLLRKNKHPNQRLQNSFNVHGEESFWWDIEIECKDAEDLDDLENLFLTGAAVFEEPAVYNISKEAQSPMRNKKHTPEAIERIKLGRNATTFDYSSEEYRRTLSAAQLARYRADPKCLARLRFIVNNPHLTYAERGRLTGIGTSSARKLYMKYKDMKGLI
jgi:group I intron endonuclease